MENENKIPIQIIRKHWIVYVSTAIWHILLVFLLAFFLSLLSLTKTALWAEVGEMITISFLLFLWTSFFYFWTNQYFDEWDIYDNSLVAINQKDILIREESFLSYHKIQDIRFEKSGILQHLLGYGTIKIQNAGEDQEFIIPDIYDVEETASLIKRLKEKNDKGGGI